MPTGRKYKTVPRPLSPEDKRFIELVSKGMMKAKAFKLAYPDHESVKRYMEFKETRSPEEIARAAELVNQATKTKLQTNRIQTALVSYQDRMEILADKSLDVAEDILDNGRSEKVKADLAIEFIRHRVGTPVQKIAVKEDKTVYITFGEPTTVIDAEVID